MNICFGKDNKRIIINSESIRDYNAKNKNGSLINMVELTNFLNEIDFNKFGKSDILFYSTYSKVEFYDFEIIEKCNFLDDEYVFLNLV